MAPGPGRATRAGKAGDWRPRHRDRARGVDGRVVDRPFDPDERSSLGLLQLAADGATRRWWASDGRQAVTVDGPADGRTYDLRISPRMVLMALLDAGPGDTAALSRSEGPDGPQVTLRARSGAVTLPLDPRPAPATAAALAARATLAPVATFRASASSWPACSCSVQWPPLVGDDDLEPPFILSVGADGLTVRVDWPGVGPSQWTLEGEATGEGYLAVPPEQLEAALREFDGDVTLDFADDLMEPLLLRGEGRQVLIMPLEIVLSSNATPPRRCWRTLGPDALQRDNGDGDYPLPAAATPIFARLIPDDPIRLVVFVVVLADVERDDELLGELNDHNSRLAFVRTFWVDGSVIVEADLIAATTDRDELVILSSAVRDAADELGPMMAALYGGSLAAASPRSAGTATATPAGVGGGRPRRMGGAHRADRGAVDARRGGAPAHRSQPARLGPQRGRQHRGQPGTGRRPARRGARSAGPSAGSSMPARRLGPGEPEHGFLVVGLSRDDALSLGRRYSQEAIFEVEGDDARVLACFKDRSEVCTRRRHGGPPP